MITYINLFGKNIPLYGICFYSGILISALTGAFLCKKRNIERFDLVGSAIYTFIGALIGSKILFLAVSLKTIIENHIPFEAVLKGGFVFYGGLIGGILGLIIYVKQFKTSLPDFLDVYSVCLPLGHAFGRIGCFFGGCCYGIEHESPISVIYTESAGSTPLHTPLLPIQLIESAVLFIFFFIMLSLFLKNRRGFLPALYLTMYSLARFILEFFRGDNERGSLLGISTSQIISIIIVFLPTVYFIIQYGKKKRTAN